MKKNIITMLLLAAALTLHAQDKLFLHLTDEEYEAFVSKRKKAFEESVIELLQSMPHWRPAIHETDGKQEYVRMRYTLPFTFKLL